MRHRCAGRKLGRTSAHREATMAALVCSLIGEKRITTTLAKAKEARRLAERMVTLGRKGTVAARRQAVGKLRRKESVAALFDEVVPRFEGRAGGYTRIVKLGPRPGDGAEMAILEWVGIEVPDKKRKTKKEDRKAA